MPEQNQILLHTKLHRPRLQHDLVFRPRLVEWLNNDLDRPLTLVCAPAGFGKTTLVCSWLESMETGQAGLHGMPAAWLSLDENDSDLNLFLRYFVASIRTIFKDACAETLALLQARQSPPQNILFATLSNELEELPGEMILVLDDYHAIHGEDVHALLGEFVHHWPKPLHLVLISRTSPPIPLGSFRAKRMVSEIRTRDLRFTPEETANYLRKTQFDLLINHALPLLEERFEGWPAGLHLAVLSLRSRDTQESVLSALSSKDPNITGYLVDEVLTQQFPAVHTFLLKTSILDRFCASLCEAVAAEGTAAWNARARLDSIERSELFIISLDGRQEWYRYHRFFQELLQERLVDEMTPDQVADLHRRASAWFEKHGLIEEALQHALAAGDFDLAAHHMSAGLREVINREDRPTLERWLRLLPEETIQRHPELLMIRVWAFEFLWRLDLQAEVIKQVESLLDSKDGVTIPDDDLRMVRGQILAIRGQQAYFRNHTSLAIDLCRQGLSLLPPSWNFVRGGAMLYLGISMQAGGQSLEAEQMLLKEYEAYGDKTDAYALMLLHSLCFIHLNNGQLDQTVRIAELMRRGATSSGVTIKKNWSDWFLGVVCYQRDELEAAAAYFTEIVENRYTAQISPYRDAVAGLALIHQTQGQSPVASQWVESISQFDMEQSGREDNRTGSLRARLMLMQGNVDAAGAWADSLTGLPPETALLWLEEPQVTRGRILVSRGTQDDLKLALQLFDTLYKIAERTHNTRYEIEILALRTLALDGQQKTEEAGADLKQALELARPGGFSRVFVDLGRPMYELLQRIADQNHSGELIQRLLAEFPDAGKSQQAGDLPGTATPDPLTSNLTLIDPLTPRELEILNLLRGSDGVKEIALALHLSPATVKRHINNIYAKLGVNKRWNAVARAEELNILPPR
jgi:LuxR family transcriptional regulator, maltose regulon positive regulatory protein